MQKALQLGVGCAAMFIPAPYLFGTPLNNELVYMALLVGGMYATARVQAHFHFRRLSRRGYSGAETATPGASENGIDLRPPGRAG